MAKMVSHSSVVRWQRLLTLPMGIAGLVAISTPITFPSVALANDYQVCATDLLGITIAPGDSAFACSKALKPQDVSSCAVQIKKATMAQAPDALVNCLRVRRPLELATCVVDINQKAKNPEIAEVLDNCRRSLLPARYSECVVGLSAKIDLTATNAMKACIDASDIKYEALIRR
ncbi:hypothetical protein BST81_23265 [Leptolyngbya sp. 'hensonii']|nr:hypothetical protein BST81_23265 [Leptolyngbya sp. 'hensonii']